MAVAVLAEAVAVDPAEEVAAALGVVVPAGAAVLVVAAVTAEAAVLLVIRLQVAVAPAEAVVPAAIQLATVPEDASMLRRAVIIIMAESATAPTDEFITREPRLAGHPEVTLLIRPAEAEPIIARSPPKVQPLVIVRLAASPRSIVSPPRIVPNDCEAMAPVADRTTV